MEDTTLQNTGNETTTRESVQEKYDRLYNPTTSETSGVVETPVVEDKSTDGEVTPVVDSNTQLMELVQSLKSEIASLKPKPTVVEEPKTITTPWFEQLRQGNFEGAEQDIINRVKDSVSAEATKKAVNEAVETIRIQLEVESYLKDLRGQNPDIAPMERYLRAPVEARLAQAHQNGKIQSSVDYVREYKAAVDAEVLEIRKVTGQYRAAGKNEATTRAKEVLSASTLPPQGVSSLQSNTQESELAGGGDLTNDYLRARLAKSASMRGMGHT